MHVISLSKYLCDKWVKAKHYSHRPSIFWAGFGLVVDDMVEGVVVYGQPSPPIQKHAFKNRDFKLYELSRLVIQTEEENAASFLVANSLKKLETPCAVISYADTEQGHAGIVYQATNWHYTGSTLSHDKMYLIDGKRTHPMSLRDKGITNPTTWALQNNVKMVKPLPKHRYFYFIGNRYEKKRMMDKLKYPIIKSYPKLEYSRYADGERIEMPVSCN